MDVGLRHRLCRQARASRAASSTAAIMLSGSATPLPGDVERRAVIDRRPDDRQPERHVHRLAERDAASPESAPDRDSRRRRRRTRRAGRARTPCRRETDPTRRCRAPGTPRSPASIARLFLAAEQPVLAGVRIEAGDGDPRRRDAEARQLARRQRDGRLERRRASARAARRPAGRARSPARRAARRSRTSSRRDARRSGARAGRCGRATAGRPGGTLPC